MGFKAGYPNRISWKRGDDTGAVFVELCNFRHGWEENDPGHEVTSSCHEGVQAFISSVLRGQGDASFHLKSEEYPWNLGFGAGAYGIIKAEFGNRNPFLIPVYIESVPFTNETAAGTDYQIRFKLNAEAGDYVTP